MKLPPLHISRYILIILVLLVLLGILTFVDARFQVPFLSLLILGPPLWTFFNARAARCRD